MTVSEFIYTVVLRPRPLRQAANAFLRAIVPSRLKRSGAIIVLNPNDLIVSGALTFGVYEKAETRFITSVFRKGDVFLDIGANVGYYTALGLTYMGHDSRIIALEPDPENFSYLLKTVEANGGTNVTCIQKAAAGQTGRMTLYTSRDNRGDNRLYPNELCQDRVDVEVTTIDLLLDELDVRSVNLIKIDVQGFEGHVLAGMTNVLSRSDKLIFMTEFWPHGLSAAGTDPRAHLTRLRQFGMHLFELTSNGSIKPLVDAECIARHQGRRYTNIIGLKGVKPNGVMAR